MSWFFSGTLPTSVPMLGLWLSNNSFRRAFVSGRLDGCLWKHWAIKSFRYLSLIGADVSGGPSVFLRWKKRLIGFLCLRSFHGGEPLQYVRLVCGFFYRVHFTEINIFTYLLPFGRQHPQQTKRRPLGHTFLQTLLVPVKRSIVNEIYWKDRCV